MLDSEVKVVSRLLLECDRAVLVRLFGEQIDDTCGSVVHSCGESEGQKPEVNQYCLLFMCMSMFMQSCLHGMNIIVV